MKFLLVAAVAVLLSTAAQACSLSDGDIKALAASPSHLTPSEFAALAPAQQESVCSTRAFIKEVDARHGVIDKIGNYVIKYLTPAEDDRIVDASNHYLFRLMKSKKP